LLTCPSRIHGLRGALALTAAERWQ
jgi:hypothetical protein